MAKGFTMRKAGVPQYYTSEIDFPKYRKGETVVLFDADILGFSNGKQIIEEHINDVIEELESILYFYEDSKGNYVKFRRAYDVVDFYKSDRKEDYINAELCNNFIV